ncbi:MAG TPA: SIS domain-containing protein [Candidatus Limnocylindrales bacterium]|jgi:fructoselysine-6-P-deglycase FrlB-like protein
MTTDADGGTTRFDEFVADILAGPDELARAIDQHGRKIGELPAEVLARPRWRFSGMGSSRFAALDAAALLRAAGRDAVAERASASSWSPAADDTLLVAISSSGRTPEVVAAAAHHRGVSFVLGLTARVDSPLAAGADAVMPLVAVRAEASGIASLSYRSTVAALSLLVGAENPALTGTGIAAAVPALEALLRDRAAWLAGTADLVDTGRGIHVLGDGARIGTVEQAALMLREGPRIEATAWDTGDWLHVGLYTLFPGDAALLLTGSPADGEAIATIHARAGLVVAVGEPHPDADLHVPLPDAALADPAIRALVEPTVAELLAAELWRRTDARLVREAPGGE